MSEVRYHVGADMVWSYLFRYGEALQKMQRKVQRVQRLRRDLTNHSESKNGGELRRFFNV